MNKIISLFILFFFSCNGFASSYSWVETLPKPWTLSEDEFETFLPQFLSRYPNYLNRLKALNIWRLNTPYGLYCLGEESGQDKDPIIRNDSSDCTVHVLTTMAFAESSSYLEAKKVMRNIHYKKNKDGKSSATYESRWHFTSDRLLNNPQTPDITLSIANDDYLETVRIELNKKKNGQPFLNLNWTSKEEIKYISIEKLDRQLLNKLPEVCGIAFVKKSYFKLGLVIAHEGFLVDKRTFFHASSEYNKTVAVDLMSYLKDEDNYRFDGLMFYKLNKSSEN